MKLMINIPILLTMARMISVPFLVFAIMRHDFSQAVALFLFAATTDFFDGASARFFKQETLLGAYLDPIADKVLVVACYAALLSIDSPYFLIPTWFIALVVVRELCILVGAWYWSLHKKLVPIAPTMLGKVTTALQLAFIGFLLGSSIFAMPFPHLLRLFLGVVSLCVGVSLGQYGYQAFQKVRL